MDGRISTRTKSWEVKTTIAAGLQHTSNNPVNATDITGYNEIGMLLQSKVFS